MRHLDHLHREKFFSLRYSYLELKELRILPLPFAFSLPLLIYMSSNHGRNQLYIRLYSIKFRKHIYNGFCSLEPIACNITNNVFVFVNFTLFYHFTKYRYRYTTRRLSEDAFCLGKHHYSVYNFLISSFFRTSSILLQSFSNVSSISRIPYSKTIRN